MTLVRVLYATRVRLLCASQARELYTTRVRIVR